MTPLRPELERILPPERILDRPIDVAAYASDASFYRLVPRAVLRPESDDEVREIFALSHRLRIPMTFRAAGTSLSGQAITDGLLVDLATAGAGSSRSMAGSGCGCSRGRSAARSIARSPPSGPASARTRRRSTPA